MVVIHTNMALGNQRACAAWLKEGFEAHGIDAEITPDKHAESDIHVIQGPHYAYREWVGKPNVIWLNRCFYGDHFYDLSLGWLNADGTRNFGNTDRPGKNGELPALSPRKRLRRSTGLKGGCCIVFGDYGRDPAEECQLARQHFDRVYYRPHPASQTSQSPVLSPDWTLAEAFSMADGAVGYSTTALIKARINGLHTLSTDPNHVVLWEPDDDERWLRKLSWCQWSSDQIRRGEFWEHLSEGFNSANH